MKWIDLKEQQPEAGREVLLYNEKWINEDYNPNGIRIGWFGDVSGWVSAYWCNYHEEYHTRDSVDDDKQFTDSEAENQVPTHWMEIEPCGGKKN